MTSVAAAPKAHKVGEPVMLTAEDVAARRKALEQQYGTREELERRGKAYPLGLDEFLALQDLEWLEEGR